MRGDTVLVYHPDGTFYAQRPRVLHLVDNGRAYWRDLAKTVLVMLRFNDDQPNNGYEYGGKKSYDPYATCDKKDPRTGTYYEAATEEIDRTHIPVREAGGATVLQLKPKMDRRTTGAYATSMHDRLWRPGAAKLDKTVVSISIEISTCQEPEL